MGGFYYDNRDDLFDLYRGVFAPICFGYAFKAAILVYCPVTDFYACLLDAFLFLWAGHRQHDHQK